MLLFRKVIPALTCIAMLAALIGASRIRHPRPSHSERRAISAENLDVQVLLDRSHFSPGQIDAHIGNVTELILRVYQAQHGIPETGEPDDATMQALRSGPDNAPALIDYTVAYEDVRGPFAPVPKNIMGQAKLKALNYESVFDELGEKFHCSPGLLRKLNPGKRKLEPGEILAVPNVHRDIPGKAARVVVSKSQRTVQAFDSNGKVLAVYPATIGSKHDPLPIGEWKVTKVFWTPIFYYNPKLFWDARPSDAKAVIRPGPRNPVGAVWIGLTREHYGIHGTPRPGAIGHVESHGCVRLTNWDAIELGQMVDSGTPVSFTE